MNYVPVLILAVLSTIKVSFQSRFSKTTVKNTADILIFNLYVCQYGMLK